MASPPSLGRAPTLTPPLHHGARRRRRRYLALLRRSYPESVRDEREREMGAGADERVREINQFYIFLVRIVLRTSFKICAYIINFCCFKICVLSSDDLAAEKDGCFL
jgi:hypothetical protein